MEDDITASVVLPRESAERSRPGVRQPERQAGGELRAPAVPAARRRHPPRLRQAGRGRHRRARDVSSPTSSRSRSTQARALVDHVVEFDQYTEPMKRLLEGFVERPETDYVVSSAHPRAGGRQASKNPRYLQKRPDLVNPRDRYLAEIAARLARGIPRGPAGAFAGERGAGGTAEQSRRIRRPACRRWPSTTRSTTRNCPSCSWTSSAA